MSRRRYELTERERSIIAPLLPDKPRGICELNRAGFAGGYFV
jgi:hypothetical protein